MMNGQIFPKNGYSQVSTYQERVFVVRKYAALLSSIYKALQMGVELSCSYNQKANFKECHFSRLYFLSQFLMTET